MSKTQVDSSSVEKVHLRREDRVAILELDNPKGGFLTANMQKEIDRLTLELESDDTVRVVILTGKLPSTFVTHYSPFELGSISAVVKGISSDKKLAKLRNQTTFMTRLVYRISRYR